MFMWTSIFYSDADIQKDVLSWLEGQDSNCYMAVFLSLVHSQQNETITWKSGKL